MDRGLYHMVWMVQVKEHETNTWYLQPWKTDKKQWKTHCVKYKFAVDKCVENLLKIRQGGLKYQKISIFCQYFFGFSIKFVNMWKLCTKTVNLFRINHNWKTVQKYSNI